ncbi:GIY-YIG nuclease family protein [Vibrio hangzhouensis]|uniref:GIY-YIG nuclease family protein n=1 Tax=Vibrio hangzhouensis TaxID=462991 RepID=UPI001C96079B|nr:GIY-YIG nuclease family protein [Vibrio hangzhouensis]MBY6197369.1 GIY-YIG nuclease family protein [Vibrio hangzhouensis]
MFRWESSNLKQSSSANLPTNSGVYVLVESRKVHGLSIDRKVLYVGKTKNLRRRFTDYSNPRKVHNELVGERLFLGNVEFWCTQVHVDNLDGVERKFIHDFEAPMNKIKYKEYNNAQ